MGGGGRRRIILLSVALTSGAMVVFEVTFNQFRITDPFHEMEAYSQSRLEANHKEVSLFTS